jgi:hypothetical protein
VCYIYIAIVCGGARRVWPKTVSARVPPNSQDLGFEVVVMR